MNLSSVVSLYCSEKIDSIFFPINRIGSLNTLFTVLKNMISFVQAFDPLIGKSGLVRRGLKDDLKIGGYLYALSDRTYAQHPHFFVLDGHGVESDGT
jgi:hypothetical protein